MQAMREELKQHEKGGAASGVMQYPYIASLKKPMLIHQAIGLDIMEPVRQRGKCKQGYVIQTTDELRLYRINRWESRADGQGTFEEELLVTQPLFTQVLAIKRVKHCKDGWIQDFLFMITKDMKMHLLHFNRDQKKLEIVSSFKVDTEIMGGGISGVGASSSNRQPKEVLYISYDQNFQTVVVVFDQNYVMTVNLERIPKKEYTGYECACKEHLEITNFTIADIEAKYALDFKRIVQKNQLTQKAQSYLCLLYDQLPSSLNPAQSKPSGDLVYNLQLHQLTSKFDNTNLKSTGFEWNASCVNLQELNLHDGYQNECQYYKFTHSSESDEFVVVNENGFFVFKVDIGGKDRQPAITKVRFSPFGIFDLYVETLTFLQSPRQTLFFTTHYGTGHTFSLQTKEVKNLDFKSMNNCLNNPYLIGKLSDDLLLLPSEQQNHQYVQLTDKNLVLVKEQQNMGSLSQIKRAPEGRFEYILNKGREKSRIFKIQDGVQVQVTSQIEFEGSTSRIEDMWVLNDAEVLVQTFDGKQAVIDVVKGSYREWNQGKKRERILGVSRMEGGSILVIAEKNAYQVDKNDNLMQLTAQIDVQNCKISSKSEIYCFLDSKSHLYLAIVKTGEKHRIGTKDNQEVNSYGFFKQDFLVVSYWSSTTIDLFNIPSSLTSPCLTLDLTTYLSLDRLSLTHLTFCSLSPSAHYLFLSLSDGTLATLNFYPHTYDNLVSNYVPLTQLFRLCNIFKVGDLISDFVQSSSLCYVTTDQGAPKIITLARDSRMGNLKCFDLAGLLDGGVSLIREVGKHLLALSWDGTRIMVAEGLADEKALQGKDIQERSFGMMVQRFDYIEEFDLMCLCCFDSYFDNQLDEDAQEVLFIVQSMSNQQQLFSKCLQSSEKPSAIKHRVLSATELIIYMGTSITRGDKSHVTPDKGQVYQFQASKDPFTGNISIKPPSECMSFTGGILDFEFLSLENLRRQFLLVGVNSFVQFFDITNDEPIEMSETVAEIDQQIYVQKIKVSKDVIMVGDIMKSLSIYKLEHDPKNKSFTANLICRDPRGQWCLDMLQMTDYSYMIADFKQNLVLLTRNPQDDHNGRVFKITGGLNLRQQVNCITADHKPTREFNQYDQPADLFLSASYLQNHKLPQNQSFFDSKLSSIEALKVTSPQQALLATADGGLYTSTFLFNHQAYLILKAIQDSLATQVKSLNEYHPTLSRPKVLEDEKNAFVFLDGDFIETLLELPEDQQLTVVNDGMGRLEQSITKVNAGRKIQEIGMVDMDKQVYEMMTLKSVRGLIEHLRQMHL